jgi:2-polyprenyl-3-methyl-5-hydroxy-6-metoxy-1,4-benzoquinol methylase
VPFVRPADRAIFELHHHAIHVPRVERIARGMAELAEGAIGAGTMLDIGCGNGLLARRIAELAHADTVRGVDVMVRDETSVPVSHYDGEHLPFEAASFDVITICDVLHHAAKPLAVVKDAIRVLRPGGRIIIKDHFRLGSVSNAVLLAMDMLGNYSTGVLVRGTYLSPSQWVDLVADAGGVLDKLVWPFDVHALPWRLVTRSEYQFVMRVVAKPVSLA